MPKVTLYVRDDDLEAFEAIPNKPEWLHNAIMAESARPVEAPTAPAPQPLQVNQKSHGPLVEPSHYEPIDDMP